MVKRIIKLILVIAWMGVIFMFSNDTGDTSSKKSESVILKVYQVFNDKSLTKKEKENLVEKVVYPVRKLAHFTEYFILGVLLLSFISEFYQITLKSIIITIILCMLYAVSDELHQLFSSGRSARIFDCFIDTLGSASGILIYSFIVKKLLRRKVYE